MSKKTQRGCVKAVAAALLLTDLNDTEFSSMIVQHPFTSSGITAVRRNGEMIMLNISQSEDDLKAWRFFMTERIRKRTACLRFILNVSNFLGHSDIFMRGSKCKCTFSTGCISLVLYNSFNSHAE